MPALRRVKAQGSPVQHNSRQPRSNFISRRRPSRRLGSCRISLSLIPRLCAMMERRDRTAFALYCPLDNALLKTEQDFLLAAFPLGETNP
ncbi:Hypothetical protein NTJ_15083 [Nesidiocoris tenuis]|uniref:Uncharacterized protein n=1 Tax=Nesidiocoris tenuis TaxID=355587 RepID=A0ABN7BD13_9HEMI|nr:Hypothetical protein NTJ_15083 [Nesidiocoris tenuis]